MQVEKVAYSRISGYNFKSGIQNEIQKNASAPVVNSAEVSFGSLSSELKKGLLIGLFPGLLSGCGEKMVNKVDVLNPPKMVEYVVNKKGNLVAKTTIQQLTIDGRTYYSPKFMRSAIAPVDEEIVKYSNGISTKKTRMYFSPKQDYMDDYLGLVTEFRYNVGDITKKPTKEMFAKLKHDKINRDIERCKNELTTDPSTLVVTVEEKVDEGSVISEKSLKTISNSKKWEKGDTTVITFTDTKGNPINMSSSNIKFQENNFSLLPQN